MLDRIVRFTTHAEMVETVRGLLDRHVLYIRDHSGVMPPALQKQLRADLGVFQQAVQGAHQDGQELQRQLNRWYLAQGATGRRLRAGLSSIFKRNKLPEDIVVTADWDVLPRALVDSAAKHSPKKRSD